MGLRHEEEEWEGGKRQEVSEPTRHTENLCEGNWGEKIPFILEQRAKGKGYEVQHIGIQTRKIIQFNLHP